VHSSRLTQFLGPDQYHQTFNFELLEADWSAPDFTHAVSTSIGVTAGTGSSPTWVLSNHDVLRDATRFGLPPGTGWRTWPADGDPRLLDAVLGAKRARAAALILLALPGSAYLYQGEELGLPDVIDLPDEVITDPMWERSGRTERGRDGCRVPLPWEPEGPSLGFGRGDAWLPQPPTFGPLAVSVQRGDERSMLTLCRSAIRARRLLLSGDLPFDPIDMGRDVFAFRRGSGFVCAANMGPEPVRLPAGRLHLASGTVDGRTLPPDTSVWLGR
jgi:alpha-glucosidase